MNPWEQEQMQQFRGQLHSDALKRSAAGQRKSVSALTRVVRMTWNKLYHRKTVSIQPAELDMAREQLLKLDQPKGT
jgi:hypothetical protein